MSNKDGVEKKDEQGRVDLKELITTWLGGEKYPYLIAEVYKWHKAERLKWLKGLLSDRRKIVGDGNIYSTGWNDRRDKILKGAEESKDKEEQ